MSRPDLSNSEAMDDYTFVSMLMEYYKTSNNKATLLGRHVNRAYAVAGKPLSPPFEPFTEVRPSELPNFYELLSQGLRGAFENVARRGSHLRLVVNNK